MFGNSQSFGDLEVTWERVYPSSRVSPLRFLPLLNSQSQWIFGAFTSWLQPTKQIRRRWWCSVVPPMAKSVFFSKIFSLEQQLSQLRISYLVLCDLLLFYRRRKEDPSFLESRRFLPIMLGEGGSYFGKDDLFCLLRNYLPDRAAARNALLFSWRRADRLVGDLILIS